MVLESIINPFRAVQRPWEMFFVGFVYANVAAFLSIWIFRSNSSLVMVFLTVLACVPLMYKTMKMEEAADVQLKTEGKILEQHSKVIKFLLMMFIGFVIAYALWFVILPSNIVQPLFQIQLETIGSINEKLTGNVHVGGDVLVQIFFNNLKVLLFAIFFSFFYGAGAIFILTWNASVISAAVGTFAKQRLAETVSAGASAGVFGVAVAFSAGLLRYFIHGIPEIAAYFVGGLAGGIVSVAMINRDLDNIRFKKIMLDALDLFLLAIGILVFAALLEVYITPLFF